MDIAIQSQIQSPLVRTLQSIPTNSMNFVHGIPDNTPPFSKNKIKIEPYSGTSKILNTQFKFKIPQAGHLSRMYMQYRMKGHRFYPGSGARQTLLQDSDNPFNFSQGIEWIELRTRNSAIERLYPSSIVFQNASLANSEQSLRYMLQGGVGYNGTKLASAGTRTFLTEPDFRKPLKDDNEFISGHQNLSHQDFLLFLPFSITAYLKDTLQTRMLEDLEVVVQMKPHQSQLALLNGIDTTFGDFGAPIDVHETTLFCDFINFHENVEEVIRNENFKPNIPATILTNDYLNFRSSYVSTETRSDINQATLLYSVDLSSDALVTSIFIRNLVTSKNSAYEKTATLDEYGLHFRLLSGGQVITEGSKFEYDGIEALQYSTVARQYQNEGTLPPQFAHTGTHIRLGLNNTDEYFDGGISFQSLTNPTLEIRVTAPKEDIALGPKLIYTEEPVGVDNSFFLGGADSSRLIFDVVLKRKVLLRIDGNTGRIQKSLES